MVLPTAVFVFLFLDNIGVSYIDVKYRKISNQWSLLNLGLFAVLCIFMPSTYTVTLDQFIIPLVFSHRVGCRMLKYLMRWKY